MVKSLKLQLQEIAPTLTDDVLEKLCAYIRNEFSYEDRLARLESFMNLVTKPQITPVKTNNNDQFNWVVNLYTWL